MVRRYLARTNLLAAAFGAGLLLSGRAAQAHGLEAGHLSLELRDERLTVVATPRSTDLPEADDDHDGRLSRAEIGAHRSALRAAFGAAFAVTDLDGRTPTCAEADVSTPEVHGAPNGPVDHVRVTQICTFEAPPDGLRVRDAHATAGAIVVDAHRVGEAAAVRTRLTGAVAVSLLARSAPAAVDHRAAEITAAEPAAASPRSVGAQLARIAVAAVGLVAAPHLFSKASMRVAASVLVGAGVVWFALRLGGFFS